MPAHLQTVFRMDPDEYVIAWHKREKRASDGFVLTFLGIVACLTIILIPFVLYAVWRASQGVVERQRQFLTNKRAVAYHNDTLKELWFDDCAASWRDGRGGTMLVASPSPRLSLSRPVLIHPTSTLLRFVGLQNEMNHFAHILSVAATKKGPLTGFPPLPGPLP